jgi:hypothetical protein
MLERISPPPDGQELVAQARRQGRPAWRLYKDRDLVIFGWAGHSSEAAWMMPLGRVEEVERQLRQWLDVDPPLPLHQ